MPFRINIGRNVHWRFMGFFCWLKIHNRNKRPKDVKKGVLHFNYLWNHRANWIQIWKKCSLNSPLMFGFFVWFEIHKNKQKGPTGCFLFLYVECLFFYQSKFVFFMFLIQLSFLVLHTYFLWLLSFPRYYGVKVGPTPKIMKKSPTLI